jgi:hypothetical protein
VDWQLKPARQEHSGENHEKPSGHRDILPEVDATIIRGCGNA